MHRSARSINQSHDDEISSIDAHQDHVNKILKWSIADLEKFMGAIKARILAEETYVNALVKIVKHHNLTETANSNTTNNNTNATHNSSASIENIYGDYVTLLQRSTARYESSLEKTIEIKREYIACLKNQMDMLTRVKESHEQRRKKVKTVLGEKNANYITFRTRDIVKLHKSYFNKCQEYATLQQQISMSSSPSQHNDDGSSLHSNDFLSPQMARLSTEESRLSSESNRSEAHSIGGSSFQDSATSPPLSYNSKKNSMAGFINQMKSQIANAAAAGDPTKQAARVAKLKKEIHDADQDYRQGVRILEFLRKKQIETAVHAMRHVEAILLGKSDAIKSVFVTLCKQEEDCLMNELEIVKQNLNLAYHMDSKSDTDRFFADYDKIGFTKPKPIYYDNYYYGRCKEILFGSNLNEYAMDHQCTVPMLVTKCINAVELLGGLEKEGIYRISGRQSVIDQLKNEFEKDEDMIELENRDVFVIASVLKIYLRELKHPLFNVPMQERIEYSNIPDETKRKDILITKLSSLSKPHRDTLQAVINHLAKVERHCDLNKMNMKNLSVIWTPALFHDHNQAENAGEWYSDKVLEDLILQHETIFTIAEQRALEQRQLQQQQQQAANSTAGPLDSATSTGSSSSSVLSLPYSLSGITRKSSLSRRPTILRATASNIIHHNKHSNESHHNITSPSHSQTSTPLQQHTSPSSTESVPRTTPPPTITRTDTSASYVSSSSAATTNTTNTTSTFKQDSRH